MRDYKNYGVLTPKFDRISTIELAKEFVGLAASILALIATFSILSVMLIDPLEDPAAEMPPVVQEMYGYGGGK